MDTASSYSTPTATPGRASGSSAGINRKSKRVERSCILCHQRKIRCDKQNPCSACTRTGVLCCYPSAAEQSVRKPRKTTIADVAERLGRLERTLVAISSSSSDSPLHNAAHSPLNHGQPHLPAETDGTGGDAEDLNEDASVAEEFLLHNGETSRYINEILISRVLEEVSPSLPKYRLRVTNIQIGKRVTVGSRSTRSGNAKRGLRHRRTRLPVSHIRFHGRIGSRHASSQTIS